MDLFRGRYSASSGSQACTGFKPDWRAKGGSR